MGFPWSFEETFEGGTKGNFNSESDTGNRLDFPGPAELAADGQGVAPFRGAYCMRVDLAKNATDAYVQEDDGFDAAAGVTRYVRMMLCLAPDIQFANNGDTVWIMQLRNASAVVEGGLILAREDERVVLKVATGSLTAGVPYVEVPIGEWFCVEVEYFVDAVGEPGDGSVAVYANGARLALLSLYQQAIAAARFGAMSQSGDLKGTLYFDQIVCDDTRLYPLNGGPKDSKSVDNETLLFTQSGFAFVGSGEILEVQAIDNGGSDARVKVYDADNPNFGEHDKRVDRRYNDAIPMRPVMLERGAYVQLSGTNPQALVRIGVVNEFDFVGDDVFEGDELDTAAAA